MMNKVLKYSLLIFGIVIIVLIALITFGLYTMEIEDHYGDYQELFYQAKDADIIINEATSQFGIIDKNWKRLNIWTKEKDTTDVYFFVSKQSNDSNIKIYRPIAELEGLRQMEFDAIKQLITEKKLKLILEYQKE